MIPAVEYNSGTVMLWDRGTWESDSGDPRAQIARGHLRFELIGERLRGRWDLVRTKLHPAADRETWLLIKVHEEQLSQQAPFDATARWTTSVATNRTMDEITDAADWIWRAPDVPE